MAKRNPGTDLLAEYNRKRDFSKTAEPAGKTGSTKAGSKRAGKAKRGNMRCMISPPVSPTKSQNSKADC